MEARKEMVYVVADESPAAQDLSTLLRAKGKVVRLFTSIRGFFDFGRDDSCASLIVSLKVLRTRQEALELISNTSIPVIFITGRSDIPFAVSAMKAGAIDVLTKPIGEGALLASVEKALQLDRVNRREATERARLVDRYESLTPREREILPLLTNGLLNKQAAFELGITEYTVQIHRGHIMRKMEADSFAALVKLATKLKLEPEPAEETNG
jgi:FixJ family two-component response regulator